MYRIGEFSYLCSMSIKTLRYYDKIGVLIPASVDELTGYRYYDIDQLEQAQKIKSLQEASFTLEEIKAILKEKNTEILLSKEKQIRKEELNKIQKINKMKKELNTAVLLITHDMGVISEMADNVIVMYAGKIVEYTNVEDLFKNPLHPYTIGLRRSIPDIDSDDQEELEVIPGSVPMLYELPKGCFFAPRCKHAKEICHQECPAMMEHGENHLVRCWKYHERWNKEDVENGK